MSAIFLSLLRKLNSMIVRTAFIFSLVAGIGIFLSAAINYKRVEWLADENISIRLDRAAVTASTIFMARLQDRVIVERNAVGLPASIIIASPLDLTSISTPAPLNAIVREIGMTNQGAANIFSWNQSTRAFDRIATTFQRPDGSPAPQVSLGEGHPAFRNLSSGRVFRGAVPVMGRKRQAYLTPILTEGRDIAGILAIDVGWLDDLTAQRNSIQRSIIISHISLLLGIILCGVFMLRRQLRPLRDIALFSNKLAGGRAEDEVPYITRKDEIGEVARGLAQVAKLQSSLRAQILTDSTTGIGSRVSFFVDLEQAITRASAGDGSSALLMLDLDLFKQINDSLGHHMGDKVLALVAGRIAEAVGPGGSVARLGGDEFGVVLPYRDPAEIAALCARLQARVAERTVVIFDSEFRLRASIGVALLPLDATTAEAAYRNADLALRTSKANGRNTVTFFSKALNDANQRETELTRMLQQALENEQFELHFQPQFDAGSLRVLGCEALLRWHHPVEGPIPPSHFVPVAERNGLISPIGDWVLHAACQQAQSWIAAGIEVPRVSVNVSVMQLRQPNFVSQVRTALDASGLPGERLCIEITESVFATESQEDIVSLMSKIRDLGVVIALDDFGTGYSSLSYLNRLPLDVVKIDRSFIANSDMDTRKRSLLVGIVALGKGLGLSIVAEGAETQGEVTLLRDLKCEGIQGYFFSRPLPAGQFAEDFYRLPNHAAHRLASPA